MIKHRLRSSTSTLKEILKLLLGNKRKQLDSKEVKNHSLFSTAVFVAKMPCSTVRGGGWMLVF